MVLPEADLVSLTEDWIERLTTPLQQEGADLVLPAYARHRYDGTITNLVIGRLIEHLLVHPQRRWTNDLPEMMAQTLGAAFSVMGRHQDL